MLYQNDMSDFPYLLEILYVKADSIRKLRQKVLKYITAKYKQVFDDVESEMYAEYHFVREGGPIRNYNLGTVVKDGKIVWCPEDPPELDAYLGARIVEMKHRIPHDLIRRFM